MGDLRDILKLKDIHDSIVDTGSDLVQVVEFHGVQYSLLSEEEQRALDQGIVSLIAGLDFPVKFWATNRPLEIRPEIDRMKTMADAWTDDPRHGGIAVVCRGIAATLRGWTDAEIPERRLFAAVSVSSLHKRALEELDRRVDQVVGALRNAIRDADPHVLDTGECLQALHAFWQKGRHIRTHAEALGMNGETVLVVEGGHQREAAAVEARLG